MAGTKAEGDSAMTVFAAPADEAALSAAVRQAAADRTRLRIRAGGTRSGIGRPVVSAQVLDMSGLSGITRYEPGSLTLEARAGTPMVEIEAALAAENQMLAFEPMDHRELMASTGTPTIGGVVAGNHSGPRRFLVGAARDFLLGVRFVDGQGRVVKNGGRVMKNVTGLDLTKLQCGAWGTLGVLSEVALKVLPLPERRTTLRFAGLDAAEAVQLFRKAANTPFEISGAAWHAGVAALRIEGLATQVDYRLSRIRALFADLAQDVLEGDDHAAFWNGVRDVHAFAGSDAAVWKVALKPTDAPAFVAAARDRLGAQAVLDQGGGTAWLAVPSEARGQAETLRGLIPPGCGHATLLRGPEILRAAVAVFQPQHKRLEQIADGLRRQFDPAGILNPGLMAG
jgi:glycolate oxidase FAD binding subunit